MTTCEIPFHFASELQMTQARDKEKERRDASWEGRRGQAERAALAEMTSAVQGRNAADYAARCKHALTHLR